MTVAAFEAKIKVEPRTWRGLHTVVRSLVSIAKDGDEHATGNTVRCLASGQLAGVKKVTERDEHE